MPNLRIKHALFLLVFLVPLLSLAKKNEKKVFLLEIRSEINPAMSRYVEKALEKAKEMQADLVLINENTYGGTVDDADKIRTLLLNFPKPIVVWINDNAASAGSLIAISADSIYMVPGANIGAATVVFSDGKPAPDKYQAFMRSKMRATAAAQGRNPEIAEGMVGTPVGKDSMTVGNVISLTNEEALKAGFSDGTVSSMEILIKEKLGIKDYELIKYEESTVDAIINIFLNAYVRTILLLIIIGGLYFELQSPGIGFPIIASITAALLYFIPSYLTGLAESWEILIFLLGLGLLIAELFLIPGFGILGFPGIALMCVGLILVMLNNNNLDFRFVPAASIMQAFTILFIAVGAAIILLFTATPKFLESKAFKRISLEDSMQSKNGWTSALTEETLIGKTGIAHTVLRPSGKILVDDQVYDASSRGEFIEKGTTIEVIAQSGSTIKVKPA